jgi:RNA polymerase sigma-70 factor, ECF subfamily
MCAGHYTDLSRMRELPRRTPMTDHSAAREQDLIAALIRRDEAAFVALVARYQGPLLRLALVHAGTRAVAEEIVQETWLGVLQGIENFQNRSSFKTWLFRILINRARTRTERESRTVPFSAFGDGGMEAAQPSVAADRFVGSAEPLWADHWAVPPAAWGSSPEELLLMRETLDLIEDVIAALPPAQRETITLRDVEGWSPEEVCNVLGISETKQPSAVSRGVWIG